MFYIFKVFLYIFNVLMNKNSK